MTKEITKANECYSCANMRRVKYNCHIRRNNYESNLNNVAVSGPVSVVGNSK